ncbi:hypothetical protein OIU79_004960 [Salix purpurea]|uniref:Uncharacterized protein n=1 Tax=Salix purpurea TaxID=77065 RepID=A0A9Q0ZA51_SALPP|nr:hypothetical protein OIU79_004960 [Salix purpurea]
MARVVPINVMTVTEMVKRKRWEVRQEYVYYVYVIHPMSYAARLAMNNNAFGLSQFTIRSIKLEKRCMIDLLRRDTRAVYAQPIQSNPLRRDGGPVRGTHNRAWSGHWPRSGGVVGRI